MCISTIRNHLCFTAASIEHQFEIWIVVRWHPTLPGRLHAGSGRSWVVVRKRKRAFWVHPTKVLLATYLVTQQPILTQFWARDRCVNFAVCGLVPSYWRIPSPCGKLLCIEESQHYPALGLHTRARSLCYQTKQTSCCYMLFHPRCCAVERRVGVTPYSTSLYTLASIIFCELAFHRKTSLQIYKFTSLFNLAQYMIMHVNMSKWKKKYSM